MKERPINLKDFEALAILAGRKTQMRLAVKPQPSEDAISLYVGNIIAHKMECPETGGYLGYGFQDDARLWRCPCGQPGDRLTGREAFAADKATGRPLLPGQRIVYRADWCGLGDEDVRWTPSCRMPLWASRITLENTGVRVERLQDISEADAIAEGIERTVTGDGWRRYADPASEIAGLPPCATATESYRTLREQINGAGGWAWTDWVWVVEFRRLADGARGRRHEEPTEADGPDGFRRMMDDVMENYGKP